MADVEIEQRGSVAWIRLVRPERMNAYDYAMAQELRQAVDASREASVIVITGSGTAFCAGGFLGALTEIDPGEIRMLYRASLDLFESIRLSPRPVIAAVNGAAAGAGNELIVACDLAIATESATFGQTGPRVGSSPVYGGANLLALSIGEKRAKEVAFMCRRYSATEAVELGWINAVVPDDGLDEEVERWADELGRMSPRYLEMTKFSSNTWWNMLRDCYVHGMGMLIQAIGSHDMEEGARAFMERRQPEWAPLMAHPASLGAETGLSGNGSGRASD